MRAAVLEPPLVAPLLGPATPGAGPHRVHHPAAATPLAAPVVGEPLGGLEGLGARVLVGDVAAAPWAERKAVRHHPAAVLPLGPAPLPASTPLHPPPALRPAPPERLA